MFFERKTKRILFSESKKKTKDFFCFKNSGFSVLRKEKEKKRKIFTKPNKQVVCWFTEKKILRNAQPQGHMLCYDISCEEYMIRE